MTAQEWAQLGLGWMALGAVVIGMLGVGAARWWWAAAALLACAWLSITQSAGLGAILAAGTLAAVLVEGPGPAMEPDFSRLTRHAGLVAAAIVAAVVVLVRLAHVEATQAPRVFPVLATAVLALVALFAASDRAEPHRAARLLLVMATVGWTVATMGSQPLGVVAAAAALPLLGLTGRLPDQPEAEPGQ